MGTKVMIKYPSFHRVGTVQLVARACELPQEDLPLLSEVVIRYVSGKHLTLPGVQDAESLSF